MVYKNYTRLLMRIVIYGIAVLETFVTILISYFSVKAIANPEHVIGITCMVCAPIFLCIWGTVIDRFDQYIAPIVEEREIQ